MTFQSFKSSDALSTGIALAVRTLASTWRLRVHDEAGLLSANPSAAPLIWVFWHNRLLIVPVVYERNFPRRKSAALISRSRDGAILAGVIERFGGVPIRGSSSQGGASALRELQRHMASGGDAYITPDGPKGPRYSVGPGALWLARATGARLQPVSVECRRAWRLGRWDGFFIPRPFSRVDVTLRPPVDLPPTLPTADLKSQQGWLRTLLLSQTEVH